MTSVRRTGDRDHLLSRLASWFAIERYTPARENELVEFFCRAYKDQPIAATYEDPGFVRRRLRWLNDGNPYALDGGQPAWICLREGRIIGHFGAIAAEAACGGLTVPVCWGRDLIVSPEDRRAGAGPLLVHSVVQAAARPMFVAGLNDKAAALYRELGFDDRGFVPVFVDVRDAERLLDATGWSGARRVAVRVAIGAARLLAGGPRLIGRLTIEPLDEFDEQFDRWWTGIEPAFGCVVRRTSATLNWRFARHPAHRYACFAARDGSRLRGVVVVRQGRSRGVPAGFVSELLAAPDDREALDTLLGTARDVLLDGSGEPPVFLRCTALHGEYARALVRHGFVRAPSPVRWMAHDAGALASRDGWLLTAGDSDLDMV